MARRDSLKKVLMGLLLAGVVIFLFQSCATKKYVLALHNESMAQNREQESRLATLKTAVATLDSIAREQNKFLMGIRALVGTPPTSSTGSPAEVGETPTQEAGEAPTDTGSAPEPSTSPTEESPSPPEN